MAQVAIRALAGGGARPLAVHVGAGIARRDDYNEQRAAHHEALDRGTVAPVRPKVRKRGGKKPKMLHPPLVDYSHTKVPNVGMSYRPLSCYRTGWRVAPSAGLMGARRRRQGPAAAQTQLRDGRRSLR